MSTTPTALVPKALCKIISEQNAEKIEYVLSELLIKQRL